MSKRPCASPRYCANWSRRCRSSALPPRTFSEDHIRAVHAGAFVDYLRRACAPRAGRQVDLSLRVPDPQHQAAAQGAAAARRLLLHRYLHALERQCLAGGAARRRLHADGGRARRCPGPASPTRWCGRPVTMPSGAPSAASATSTTPPSPPTTSAAYGRVAVLDVDYHHGNGTQDIFWTRSDVLTISIHGHPSFAYPYFSGFADEVGEGAGKGLQPQPAAAGERRS